MTAARETIEQGFLVIVQLLPPRQRAVLILRELLAWSAAETVDLPATSPAAVNSAMQRARATLRAHEPDVPTELPTDHERRLLAAYATAHELSDPGGLIRTVRADLRAAA